MTKRGNAIRLSAYVAVAGTVSAAEADVQLYDGPPISLNGNFSLELGGLNFQFDAFTRSSTTFFGGSWTFCCGYGGGKSSTYCTNWAGSWYSTYLGWKDLRVDCGDDLQGVGFRQLGEVVGVQSQCGGDQTDLCSFSYFTRSECGDISYNQVTDCNDTRRFHVGFSLMQDGTEIFGWIQIEGPSYDLNITRWAYEDSGAPIIVGQQPAEPCIGNLNGDAVVDSADIGLLLSAWGSCQKGGACPADLNGDWSVDAADLGLLLSRWGDCPDPCEGVDCADGDDCTTDVCIEGQCYYVETNQGDCWPGECCSANGTPGCEDSMCENIVCASLPNCCDVEWDTSCAVFAQILGCDCP